MTSAGLSILQALSYLKQIVILIPVKGFSSSLFGLLKMMTPVFKPFTYRIVSWLFLASLRSLSYGVGWSFRGSTAKSQRLALLIYRLCVSVVKCNKSNHILITKMDLSCK